MKRQMFVNLPVKDLPAAMAFFRALGFEFNPQFTNDTAACMIVHEGASYVMLLREPFFQSFTPKPIADATRSTEVLVCLSCESDAEVDDLVRRAVAAGGKTYREPQQHGDFMYQHGFQDPDGHIWEVVHMNVAAFTAASARG